MTINTDLPMNLYKANLELLQNTGRLIQESSQQFMAQGAKPGDLQAFASNAASSQAAFVAGWTAAVQTWQKEASEAMSGVASAMPANPMGDFLKQFGK
ncbi:MAG TPA: hypothetical protein DCW29_19435 [Janthinobacterium sp.]|nr:hypothetical protein [Janthinobacterium sp.]